MRLRGLRLGCTARAPRCAIIVTVARWFSALVLSLALLFAPAGPAQAARTAPESGIQVDPDSAPAHEYALPLDAARSVGAGASARDASGAPTRPPAFGAGITRKPTGASGRSRSGAAASSRAGGDRGSDAAGATRADPAAARGAARADDGGASGEAGTSGATALLVSLGAAVVVLGAGGLLALTLRRRQPSM